MKYELSQRLKNLPPYLFAEIDEAKRKAVNSGRDIVDLGVGDPDLPTPDYLIESMKKAVEDSSTHSYPSGKGLAEFRNSIVNWYKDRFGVLIDSDKEVLPLIGSKEGIAHFPLGFINPGDLVLVPEPSYPPYTGGTTLANGEIYEMPLTYENDFLPDFNDIPQQILEKAKIMFINYPNNPTGAVADKEFFSEVIDFAKENDIIVAHDAAYSEISFDGYKPPSFLELPGAKEIGVEFHSLSKTFNMTGWRLGWVCGNEELVNGIAEVKSNIDSGVFEAVQKVGIKALSSPKSQEHKENIQKIYSERQKIIVEALKKSILEVIPTKATFYLWCKLPEGRDSTEFTKYLLEEVGVVVTPGVGLGDSGEGYIRISLTAPKEELKEAARRLKTHV